MQGRAPRVGPRSEHRRMVQAATRFMPPQPAHPLPARAACKQSGTPRQSRPASCGHRQPSRAAGLGRSGERERQHAHVLLQELAGTTGQIMLGTPSRPCCLPPQAPLGAPPAAPPVACGHPQGAAHKCRVVLQAHLAVSKRTAATGRRRGRRGRRSLQGLVHSGTAQAQRHQQHSCKLLPG